MKLEKPTLLDWLHIKKVADYSTAPWLGTIVSVLLLLIAVSLVLFGIYVLLVFYGTIIGFGPFSEDKTGSAIRNLGLVLVAMFGAPLLIWRAVVAQKQVNVSEQGQITDRINKAVEGLGSEKVVRDVIEIPRYQKDGEAWKRDENDNLLPAERPDGKAIIDRETHERTSPNIEVRLGAIYALERIAQDSIRDHIQVLEILCAYIRENTPAVTLEPTENLIGRPIPRVDIQTAISVIGRRSKEQVELEWQHRFRLDLRNTDLSGVDFRDGDFSAAIFHECRLEGSFFDNCKLLGTQFHGSLLNFSSFFSAKLRGTRFDHVTINRPEVVAGGMASSFNMGEVYGISVVAADITAVDYLGEPNDPSLVFGSKDTKLCVELELKRGEVKRKKTEIMRLNKAGDTAQAKKVEVELRQNFFVEWCRFDSTDGALGYEYNKLIVKLGLVGWPYQKKNS